MRENFYFQNTYKRYLNLTQAEIDSLGYTDASQYLTVLTQFRPSIQLKTLFKLILTRAGFSYTSSFIDGDYFGKLFMTTGGHLEASAVPTTNSNTSPSGLCYVATNQIWGEFNITNNDCYNDGTISGYFPLTLNTPFTDEGLPSDADGIWNNTEFYFTKTDYTMENVEIYTQLQWSNMTTCYQYNMGIIFQLESYDTTTGQPLYNDDGEIILYGGGIINTDLPGTYYSGVQPCPKTISLAMMPVGAKARIKMTVMGLKRQNTGLPGLVRLGISDTFIFSSFMQINWNGYSIDIFGGTVDVPSCIDPDLKQKDFLKDLVQRFNLVIVTDPNDDSNLIIEPYNDYIGDGEIKQWTNKLDLSKEVIVKDTTELQKKVINLSDQEDQDIANKEIKEFHQNLNVFGHIRIEDWNNEYAKGEMKNDSIFSPYINGMIYRNANVTALSHISNMAVQYEFTVEQAENETKNPIKKTKSKLFFYNGEATPTKDALGNSVTYNLHNSNPATGVITAYEFTTFPLCTPFNIDTNASTYNLTLDQKSLYWNATPPIVGDLECFSYSNPSGNWFNGSLFGYYWRDYLTGIYSKDARIMVAYINLDAYDIFQFQFNDEVFIKDTYWRILKIENYQVGQKASTKVTFIKSLDTKSNCNGCTDVLGTVNNGGDSNFTGDATTGVGVYVWCPEDNPDCSPLITGDQDGYYTSPECCNCNGGYVMWNQTANASQGLYPCQTMAGSPPIRLTNKQGIRSIFNSGTLKGIFSGKLAGQIPFIIGSNNNKYSEPIFPFMSDDSVIKYQITQKTTSALDGESHKMVVLGRTVGTTKGYAYPRGNKYDKPLIIPTDTNIIMRIKGISSVIDSKDASYPVGSTEAFAYYTAFKSGLTSFEQLGTAGGQVEFSLKESGAGAVCSLYIDVVDGLIEFGLICSQANIIRLWELSVEMDINRIPNLTHNSAENNAVFQNGDNIRLQNLDYLVWN